MIRVQARAIVDREIPEALRQFLAQRFLTEGRAYRVWAIWVDRVATFLLIVDDNGMHGLYPAWCFTPQESSIPDGWVFTSIDGDDRVLALLAPPHFANLAAFSALLEWEPAALEAFWGMVRAEHRRDVADALRQLEVVGGPEGVPGVDGLPLGAFELAQAAKRYLDSGAVDLAALPEQPASATIGRARADPGQSRASPGVAAFADALDSLGAALRHASEPWG
ncbi:MAG: hypothetical protein U0667_18610 [Chloroflexota bacterium]